MNSYKIQFQQKSLATVQTVAELFRHTREELRLDVQEIARELQISPLYLEALEKGSYGQLPCLIYTRNFVKSYARALQLPLEDVVKQFEKEWVLFSKHQQPLLQDQSEKSVSNKDLWRMPRWIRWGISTLGILAIITYLGSELYALRQPPELTVFSPEEEVMTDKQLIEIAGQTEPEVSLSINDQKILSDTDGNFEEMITLQPGLNVIEIKAQKKYSQVSKVYRKVIVENQPVMTDSGELFRHRS